LTADTVEDPDETHIRLRPYNSLSATELLKMGGGVIGVDLRWISDVFPVQEYYSAYNQVGDVISAMTYGPDPIETKILLTPHGLWLSRTLLEFTSCRVAVDLRWRNEKAAVVSLRIDPRVFPFTGLRKLGDITIDYTLDSPESDAPSQGYVDGDCE
jgi:hypothetical protein